MLLPLSFRDSRERIINFLRDEEGSPLVEFSILAPMFFMMMFGIIEWGNVYFVQNNMLLAARMAARATAVGTVATTPLSGVVAVACGTSTNPTPLTGSPYSYTFTFSYNQTCPTAGNNSANPSYGLVTMKISTPAAKVSLINYLGSIASTTNLNASATMQEEFVCPIGGSVSSSTTKTC